MQFEFELEDAMRPEMTKSVWLREILFPPAVKGVL